MQHPLTDVNRRDLLKTTGLGVTIPALAQPVAGNTSTGDNAVTVSDQESDGKTIVVNHASTDTESLVHLLDSEGNRIGRYPSRGQFGPDETVEDVTIELDEPLSESQEITAKLYESNGPRLDIDTALISLDGPPPERIDGFDPMFVEADPDAGFNYPYFLYAPSMYADRTETPILVEPNNTGTSTDDMEEHRAKAERRIGGGTGRRMADALDAPFLMPVFPRPRSDPVDWTHYVHQLDRTTMQLDEGSLERVDLQLLSMVEDAQSRLRADDRPIADDIMLNGFSASGNFVDRFTVLHPDRVRSVTAGGLNGMALLPLEEADGHTLNYHVGIADVESLTGDPVDLEALDEVNQFLYMGAEDTNDTLPYDDAWTEESQRDIAKDVYGDDMITERFPRCQEAYQEQGIEAQFRVYPEAGHTPQPAMDDMVEFHGRSIEGKDVSSLGESLVAKSRFDLATDSPTAEAAIEFDAKASEGGVEAISQYLWEFDDGETAVGETVTHTYDEPGEYEVTLTLVEENGAETETTKAITVAEASTQKTTTDTASEEGETTDEQTESEPAGEGTTAAETTRSTERAGDDQATGKSSEETAQPETTAEGPGFGLGSTLASVSGLGYLVKSRVSDSESEQQ